MYTTILVEKSKLLIILLFLSPSIVCVVTSYTYHQNSLTFYPHHSTTKKWNNIKKNNNVIVDTNDNIKRESVTKLMMSSSSSDNENSNNNNKLVQQQQALTYQPSTIPKQKKKVLKPFSRYLEIECWKRQELRALQPVLQAVSDACKQINRIVQRAQTDDLYGAAVTSTGSDYEVDENGDIIIETNIQGEIQQKLDVVCNTFMMRALCGSSSKVIMAIASEEEDVVRSCCDVMGNPELTTKGGDYVAVFDPIDGSKNIDSSLPVGTIFGIYKTQPGRTTTSTDNEANENAAFLQKGDQMVAAGYCLYSATTVLVLTLGSGVDGFTLDPDKGTFLHTHQDMRIPSSGTIYSFNEANFHDYNEPVQRYLNALKSGLTTSVGKRSTARYLGSLVADVHNILINGGIFGYPATYANPDGKLRLLYECCPMAMIMEQAGGAASTGYGRILDSMPNQIHQRIPTFLGSIENVFELDQFFQYYGDDNNDSSTNDGHEDKEWMGYYH